MNSFLLATAFCLLNAHFITSQVVTSCSQCRYGECEQLQFSFSCHCVMGVKGTYCDRLLENGEDFCLSNPCWNGGICRNLGFDWSCDCPPGRTGKDCRTITGVTGVTFPPQITTPNRVLPDKYVRVYNKGGYTALLTVEYYMPGQGTIKQYGSITSGQSYAFYIPGANDYTTEAGAVIEVRAAGGNRVFAKKITANPECFDVWGTTLNGAWSNVNC